MSDLKVRSPRRRRWRPKGTPLHESSARGGGGALSQGVEVGAAALETALEGLALVRAGIAVAEAGATLLIGFAAIGGVLCGLEATAKIAFILGEIASVRLVGFFLGITEADPPHVASAIDAFGASSFQRAASGLSLLVIGGEGDDGGVSLAQRVFVDEQFVFGKAFGGGVFHRCANAAASDGAEDASGKANSENGADTRHEKTSQESWQRAGGGYADRSADGCAHGLAHAGLLGGLSGKLREFGLGDVRSQDIDFVVWDAEGYKLGSRALSGRARLEKADNRFHGFVPFGPCP